MIVRIMDAISVGYVEGAVLPYGASAAGAGVGRESLAMLLVPAVFQLAPHQSFGFSAGVVAVAFADGGALLELIAPALKRP